MEVIISSDELSSVQLNALEEGEFNTNVINNFLLENGPAVPQQVQPVQQPQVPPGTVSPQPEVIDPVTNSVLVKNQLRETINDVAQKKSKVYEEISDNIKNKIQIKK